MWTPTTRAQRSRAGLRYGSDVTDAEWLILAPFLPVPCSCGCPCRWEMREIIKVILWRNYTYLWMRVSASSRTGSNPGLLTALDQPR